MYQNVITSLENNILQGYVLYRELHSLLLLRVRFQCVAVSQRTRACQMSTRSKAKERHFTIDELRRYQLRADAIDDKLRNHVLRSTSCKDCKFDIS
ncbi:MAG: hypothetical protein EZS28_004017 [Streblomastix strix]|uniref:Uncharacterized protein n=1 Tax=Streblomastix strix TaxID=222440 RepID=A0A5J4X066_9EUKA|nr:MAG: hypothetical protein EZS28_004017 [Streblomastix strix]